jgi:CRP-like cAMP-binding protein
LHINILGNDGTYNCRLADNRINNLKNVEELIRTSLWGKALKPEELERVLTGTSERLTLKGGLVCMKGEPVEYWTGVISGLCKMAIYWDTGKTTSLTGISTGAWFGEGSLLKNENRRYDVMAIRDTRIASMNRQTFFWLMENSISFNRYLITQLNERLGQFIGIVENERLLDTNTRIARYLANFFNPVLNPSLNRQLQISQEELGYLTGVSRQRANQALKVLVDAGLVRVEYGGINIIDVEGLRTYGKV